ncbi:MAG TPA: hypothetical protein QGG32_04575, partial [Rhodospirillales bacterium]|nr:hypothetical protein [Rhodospirillales bacterium]
METDKQAWQSPRGFYHNPVFSILFGFLAGTDKGRIVAAGQFFLEFLKFRIRLDLFLAIEIPGSSTGGGNDQDDNGKCRDPQPQHEPIRGRRRFERHGGPHDHQHPRSAVQDYGKKHLHAAHPDLASPAKSANTRRG